VKRIFNRQNIKNYIKSLQFRIFLAVILVGIIPIMLIKYETLKSYEEKSISQRSVMVHGQAMMIAEHLGEVTYIEENDSEFMDTELLLLANLYSGRIIIINKKFRIVKDTHGIDENKFLISEEVLKSFREEDTLHYDAVSNFIEMTVPIHSSTTEEMIGVMIVSTPTDDIEASSAELSKQVFILQVGMAVAIFAIAFALSKMLVKPFDKVTHSLDELTGGFGEEDLSILDYTETQMLSEAYNKLLTRMKVLDDSRQEFVSNVSHELKTPITSMKVLADSLLMQEDVPAELYKEFLTDIAEEIEREDKIINDLLSLVKMDRKALDVNIRESNINELLELIVKRLKPIAGKRDIDLVLESFKPVIAEVDETKLTLALSNLVENAIKYNKDEGWVHLSVNVDNKYFYVKVEDSGMGIPEEAQEHIFERFYRVDKSHSKEIGGTGLGLAITRSAVLLHRGAVKVYSKEGEGTTFTVRIPLTYIA